MTSLRIGISTCPNDTFTFHALLAGAVRAKDLELEFVLADVEELNRRMLDGTLDAAKVSFHAALARADDWFVLPSGSALGFGVGPLLLGATADCAPRPGARVLCPGRWTTAALLWRLFHDGQGDVEHVVFSDIFPALQGGAADLGVCIHEGRFTWREAGLHLVEDLGQRFEERTSCALPLGGIVADRALGAATARRLQQAIAASLNWARDHSQECLPTMRAHAQELSDEVLWSHVELYVNDQTHELGATGREALSALASIARERGLLAPGSDLTVLEAAAS